MTEDEYRAESDALAAEAAALREKLAYFESLVHDRLGRDTSEHNSRINNAERHIREIVLRLVEVEREQIELNVAKAL